MTSRDGLTDPPTVVVVNYGSHALLERNLTATVAALPGTRAVVVDSWSGTEERDAMRGLAEAQGWSLVLTDVNVGFGAGMNRGVARARELGSGPLVLLNPDAWITGAGLADLAAAASRDPGALVAPRVVRPDGTLWSAGVTDLDLRDGTTRARARRPGPDPRTGRDVPVQEWLSGACLALTLELWDRVGGFDEDYFLYWEDVDLSARVLAAGGTLVVADGVQVVHDEGGTHHDATAASSRAKSATYYYFNIRNRLLYASKHLGPRDVRRWRRASVRVGWQILLEGGRRQLVTGVAPWLAALRGTRDGLRLARGGTGGSRGTA